MCARRLKVRECPALKWTQRCSAPPIPPSYMSDEDQQAAFARVKKEARLTRYHGDCYIFAMLAMGFVDMW